MADAQGAAGTLGVAGHRQGDGAGRHADVVDEDGDGIVGLSLEVVESWVKGVAGPKTLDELVTVVERQRVVIADKVKAKAKRKAAAGW
jgi:hypothetical protein